MRQCIRCLYTERHPFKITINDDGLCSGCRVHDEKLTINWTERFETLKKLADQYRRQNGDSYDCIVPITIGKESYYTLHIVKNVLGLNPLVVIYNTQFTNRVGARNLANLRETFDVDLLTKTLDPEFIKTVTRLTLREFGNVYWHVVAGNSVYPVEAAVNMKIPLIIWGGHQGMEQTGMFSHFDMAEMTQRYREEHDLFSVSPKHLATFDPALSINICDKFTYPQYQSIADVGVKGIYLNNYISWDPLKFQRLITSTYGYENYNQERTFDNWSDINCTVYNGAHDILRLAKHGYSKVTDHLNREIRWNRIDKETAQSIERLYRFQESNDITPFCNWLGISENSFWYFVKKHLNRDIWGSSIETYQWNNKFSNFKEQISKHQVRINPLQCPAEEVVTSTDLSDNMLLFTRGVCDE